MFQIRDRNLRRRCASAVNTAAREVLSPEARRAVDAAVERARFLGHTVDDRALALDLSGRRDACQRALGRLKPEDLAAVVEIAREAGVVPADLLSNTLPAVDAGTLEVIHG